METLQYSNPFLGVSSCIATETICSISRRQHHSPSSSRSIPISPSLSAAHNDTLFKYTSASPPLGLSPVQTISTTLNSLAVNETSPPKLSPPVLSPLVRSSSVRRNLSLSLDCITKPLAEEEEESLSFRPKSPFSFPDKEDSSPSLLGEVDIITTSPYKSPKRTRPQDDEDEKSGDVVQEELPCFSMDNVNDDTLANVTDTPSILVRSSSAHVLLEGGKHRKHQRARSLLMNSDSGERFTRPLVQSQPNCILPTVPSSHHPDLSFITTSTVVDLMDGKYSSSIAEFFIIDCRFPYEYEGGHIKNALNLTENQIKQMFIDNLVTHKKIAIVFHCEFSSQRAPRCCRFLRELDRKLNLAEYPKLYYPDVYVIEGGYKNFFENHKDYCDGIYVEMRDEKYSVEMKAHCGKLRTIKRARSLSTDCFSSLVALTSSKYS